MSQIYENDKDLKKEKIIAKVLEEKWRCELYKAPISYHADYFAVDKQRVKSLLELKHKQDIDYKFLISKSVQAATGVMIASMFKVPYIQAHFNLEEKLILYKVIEHKDFSLYGPEIVHTKNNNGRKLKNGKFPYYDFVLKIPKSEFVRIEY